jgi:hypothetical protein
MKDHNGGDIPGTVLKVKIGKPITGQKQGKSPDTRGLTNNSNIEVVR